MPYCISFKEIPDQGEVIQDIILQIERRKKEVRELEALRHAVIKNEIAPLLTNREFGVAPTNIDESEDEEGHAEKEGLKGKEKLAEIISKQTMLMQTGKDTSKNKKIHELLRIKEEP